MNRGGGHAWRAIRDGLVVAGLLFGIYLFAVIAPAAGTFGFDARSYWDHSISDPYAIAHGMLGAFVYSPVIARLFAPFSLLPWESFVVLWTGALVATATWLGGWRGEGWRRIGWLYVLAFPPVALELYHGNVHLLIAAAIALGFRYPATWAFVLLTKVTPGVGLLWFVVRREWKPLGIALGLTAALVGLSLIVDAPLWSQWIQRDLLVSLEHPPDQPQIAIPLWIRLAVAAVLIAWGARTDRRWVLPVAAAISTPVLWIASFSILAAIPAITRPELREQRAGSTPAAEKPKASVPADLTATSS